MKNSNKFGFIVHPLCYSNLQRFPLIQQIEKRGIPPRAIEQSLSSRIVPSMRYGTIENINFNNRLTLGMLYLIPSTTQMILINSPRSLYRKIITAVLDATMRGCSVFGLGAYTSIRGDAGVTVQKWSPIPITTGSGYTVVAVLQTIKAVCQRCSIREKNARVLVVGATGSIGSACARLLSSQVGELVIISSPKSQAKLRQLADEIGCSTGNNLHDELAKADIIVSATSSPQPLIDIAQVKSGGIVCDVSRPFDVFGSPRDDVLVIASGEVILPGNNVKISSDIGLPRKGGKVYACLAETALLAMTEQYQYATVGRSIKTESVEALNQLGKDNGFKLAPLEGLSGLISDEQFERFVAYVS